MAEVAEISIKGMVCNRCISTLKTALETKGALVQSISLGKITLLKSSISSIEVIEETLRCLGFEILVEKQTRLIATVKELVSTVLMTNRYSSISFSGLISENVKMSYDTVSAIFSAAEGITLEHYIINQKIELVKKMLNETDLNLTEISYRTNYSSVHYLSKQFKAVAGLNPSEYRVQAIQKNI
jgi:AraC family transcriptional regulator